ncbi:MAG: uracil-DNA glycosylase [Methyloceanibacter sp.]
MTGSGEQGAANLLGWYEAMGVDEAIGESPVNCFAPPPPERAAASRANRQPVSARPRPEAGSVAPASIEAAATLTELEALVAEFEGCALKRTAKSLCFARGSGEARIMMIGEAPGRDEDLQGKPFVGRAGQLLDRMFDAICLSEADVYITNTIYWRPPGNRTPTPQEVQACAPFLERQIELLAPDILVLLGGAAAKHVLGVSEGIMRLRGKWLTYSCAGRAIPALATFHPAYLLRTPADKRYAWRDLLMLKAAIAR